MGLASGSTHPTPLIRLEIAHAGVHNQCVCGGRGASRAYRLSRLRAAERRLARFLRAAGADRNRPALPAVRFRYAAR